MISEQISHYRILGKLGAGGMGEVYLAEDIRLGRQVALKFLPASYQYDPDRRARFMQEARAASLLRSPYIAAIFDIGEHEDALFIVMEYVSGELLSRRIRSGSISVTATIDIAIQIADALDEAHSQGIIHRDIKSSNLLINERGSVKVLDFGLAKFIKGNRPDQSGQTVSIGQQTASGMVVGTVSYMSPEQALGQDIDHRSDIFSLGVVLYEMLTGHLPFEGASSTEIIDKLVHEMPPAIARLNYSVPPELERIVRKCLEKDRNRRYQSSRELLIDLSSLQREGATVPLNTTTASVSSTQPTRRTRGRKTIDSLAILPLVNESNDPDTEYLTDGITESIINNLSQLPRLRVMARSTVFRYKGRHIDPIEVGRTLDVRAVLTGRVLGRADRLLIRVELVDALDGSHLWGEQYNRGLSDIFLIEEEISREISEKLRLRLTGAQKKQLRKRHTDNTEAYQLYLKGRFCWARRTIESLKKSIEYFERAISIDPKYALSYTGLADSYNILASYSALAPDEAFPIAKAAAMKALELDDNLAEAHTSLAFVRLGYDWDWAASEAEFKRAIELNPGYSTAHLWYALLLAAMGRFDEAMIEIREAESLDPLSLPIITNVGWILHLSRRYDEAIDKYRKALDMDPNFVLARRRLGQTYKQVLRFEEAVEELQSALPMSEEDTETVASLGHTYAISGRIDEARKVLDALLELSKKRYIPAYFIASIYMGMGEKDLAFEWLEKAFRERYGFLAYLNVEPSFDCLRFDPRFSDLARRIGLPV